jgi:hypothetical protein
VLNVTIRAVKNDWLEARILPMLIESGNNLALIFWEYEHIPSANTPDASIYGLG